MEKSRVRRYLERGPQLPLKLRQVDPRRGKGKRGGLRVIYFWWKAGRQFWLFTLYDKDTLDDLSATERKTLKGLLKRELEARR